MAIEWYCRVRGQLRGPLSSQELKALAGDGQLAPDSLVRQGSAGAWVKAGRVKGLFQGSAADPARNRAGAGGADDPSALPPLSPAVLPVGRVVTPAALPQGQPLPGDDLPEFGLPLAGATNLGPGRAGSGRSESSHAEHGVDADRHGMSIARVMTVAVIGLAFSFAGLCVSFSTALSKSFQQNYPGIVLVPAVLGIVGVVMAVRALLLNPRRHTGVLVVIGAAAVLGVTSGGWGLYNAVSGEFSLRVYLQAAIAGKSRGTSADYWHPAGEEEAKTATMQIAISEAAVERMKGDVRVLMIKLRLTNISSQKVNYVSWSGRSAESEAPTLQDDKGNTYQRVKTPGLDGQLGSVSFNPSEKKLDLLVFENPREGGTPLELTLPGSAIGESEPIRFKIPRSLVMKQAEDEDAPIVVPGAKLATKPAVAGTKPTVVEIRSEEKHLDPPEPEPKK